MPGAADMLLRIGAEMWVLAYRDGDHSQQTTTGAVEGMHNFYKKEMGKISPMLCGRGLAKLFGFFFDVLEPHLRMRAWRQLQAIEINTFRRDIVAAALEAAKALPRTAVTVVDAAAGSCMVQSGSRQRGEYRVQSALGEDPTCTCPVGRGGMFCKHVAACMLAMGVAELAVLQVRGILHGTHAGHALAVKLAAQHAAMPSTHDICTADVSVAAPAAAEAALAPAQAAPPAVVTTGSGTSASAENSEAAGGPRAQASVRAPVDQRVALQAAVERLMRATGGCETHSIRLEELARQLTMHAKHQEALNLRDGYGEQPQSQPLMPISNSFNSNSVKRVPGALDGNSKRKAAKNAAQRRTAACPADAALLPAASNKKKKLTHQQQLAADGGDAAAAKWLSQLPDDVKGSWEPDPSVGGELMDLVVTVD